MLQEAKEVEKTVPHRAFEAGWFAAIKALAKPYAKKSPDFSIWFEQWENNVEYDLFMEALLKYLENDITNKS